MHVHASQPNPYAQLDALRSAQRAAEKRDAEQVRKELIESASELAGESDFSDLNVMEATEQNESQRHPKRGSKRNSPLRQDPTGEEPKDSTEDAGAHISDWA
jgi:hypothetical protein